VRHRVRLSGRAAKDLDRLGRDTQQRIVRRLDQLAEAPFDSHLSIPLKNADGLRRSRVGAWRIIFSVNQESAGIDVVTIERRGLVYQRI
jgi:mRNA-degrading endonuclease RelE of RelBE toxin-antitoxin system